jgi:hypothetical protein
VASKMIITFSKEGKSTGWVVVELNDNETTSVFVDLIKQGHGTSTHNNTSISRDKLDIVNSFLELKAYVDKINNSTYDIKIDVDITSDITLKKLFDLHECVERLGQRQRVNDPDLEKCETLDEVVDDFAQLNKLIHKLEGTLHGGEWLTASFGAPVGDPDLKVAPLKYRMLQEATFGYKRDRLYLDYCETGKNMGHIFQQNDVETLQRKMVQPQRNIHPSIFLNFKSDMVLNFEDYKKWCIDNNAEEFGYDYENPRWWGVWELGTIVKASFKKLSDFPYYDTIKAKIL